MWTQQDKLTGTGMAGSLTGLGTSVALSADGNTAIAGGPYDDDFKGATWVFLASTLNSIDDVNAYFAP